MVLTQMSELLGMLDIFLAQDIVAFYQTNILLVKTFVIRNFRGDKLSRAREMLANISDFHANFHH